MQVIEKRKNMNEQNQQKKTDPTQQNKDNQEKESISGEKRWKGGNGKDGGRMKEYMVRNKSSYNHSCIIFLMRILL